MYVELLAATTGAWLLKRWAERETDGDMANWSDLLGEFAGRGCYRAFERKNPATATNKTYLNHIIEAGHHSVLEHASATFSVTGVSRHLLGELTRHRHLSYSVESLRYCPPRRAALHPGVAEDSYLVELMSEHWEVSVETYNHVYERLLGKGLAKKQAREIAAQWLPLSTATDLVVSGNLRAWRDVLLKRNDPAANREIRLLARLILAELRLFAPNSFQDMEA
ncbi:FAD-dependent thymidylate synthase [Nonomuraea typhae]|uniref:FAD-dependent thymidylate synthase n=1 Tax=Nonomuraea typhae TaxID=2603600 RepID=A0ABW7YJ65_9ACTN